MVRIRKVPLWETATTINATAVIAKAVDIQKYLGDAFAIKLVIAGSGPSLDLSYECLDDDKAGDNATGTTPYDSAGNDISAVTSTITASKWIQFSPVLTPWLNIKLTGDGSNGVDTTVTAYLYIQEHV